MPKFAAVSSVAHKETKVQEDRTFKHVRSQHIVSLVVHEFSRAAHDYPIIFVKDTESGQMRAAAMLGLKQEQNLFFAEDGWKTEYKPESILSYPFLLAPDPKVEGQQVLVVDDESDRLNTEKGQPLFDEEGKQTEFTTKMADFISDHMHRQSQTQEFIKELVSYDLIGQQSLEISVTGKDKQTIEGLYLINEEALNKLSDSDFLKLRKKGVLTPIYSCLFSMSNMGKLIKLANQPE